MNKLIQTNESSIIYGTFRGEENQELFRCPRTLDNVDLSEYINENRMVVCPMDSDIPFVDDDTEDLRNVPGMKMIAYWRMYFRDGFWDGRWMSEIENLIENIPSKAECAGVNNILDYIFDNFKKGCDYQMKDFFETHFKKWGGNERYLIKPFMSKYYKIMVDTTYGNGDYPIRIYVYREENSNENI
ncbi:MAG: hypothetical protein J5929_01880 [Eubacterium sp.]|nr:hypothetical protein [Eubacterium sp.]